MVTQETVKKLKQKAKDVRAGVVRSIGVGVAGHLGGSGSAADLVTALYFYKMNYDPQNPKLPERDRFLLSKGHVAILQYAAMAEAGYFPKEDLLKVKEICSNLQGHPDVRKTPGIEAGTGSLGQGLSIGLGMALGLRMDGIGSKVYVLMGDGEIAEGQIWEAAMAAGIYKADNLVGILDCNGLQATGRIKDRYDTGELAGKWREFGWNVIALDGHSMEEIVKALDDADGVREKPTLLLAHTVKGKGYSFAENVAGFHNGMLTQEQYDQALAALA